MNFLRHLTILLSLFITLPIWYYLLYKLLVSTNASELMFFLFWVYVPTSILGTYMIRATSKE